MPPALRLVVVWMVGALALAVAWCVHVRREGQPLAAAAAPAPPPAAAPVVDGTRDAITHYLRIRYDGADYGFAYTGQPLTEIENPVLRRLLPDTRFFATKLHHPSEGWTHYFGQVDLLVSFKRAPGPADDIRSWPLYRGDGPALSFLTQFLGISASTWSERRDLALAVAQLLAATTDGGSARSSTRCFMDTYAELWRGRAPWLGREHWRDIYVFSEHDRVSRVTIWNQIDHRLEAKVSSY